MRVNILDAWIDALSIDEIENRISHFVSESGPHQIVTLNPEILYRAQKEPALLRMINCASLVTADGVGVVWASRVARCPVPERVTGIDLMLRLTARCEREGWSIYLLGGKPGVAGAAASRLIRQYPQLKIAGTHHGYFDSKDKVVQKIKESRPQILFVGMGAPGQDYFIHENLSTLGVPVGMGVGGSFDVIAGRVTRAPVWVQKLHLEWLYRFIKEPSRIGRMAVLPMFAWLVLRRYFVNS
ncbi:MAG: Glycosyl transferase, WecB/TagA/CpsF family [Desulfotomaculum sp. 46_80]|nr:MAG: Glycosyl transferase, WecB/TagA/CpsF family [Desulfotomaculum sp. 46_80]HAU31246.1 glycosyltransferase [Desulfotomaculum sp.]